ncbi:hypothetical protein [Natronoglomus mannanivorans]|uniref:Uncharacterized protein n=1 Tax=Natronoglomus mannanivorans TaxID=2979990 RepID=A0AAP2Z406_9EURY|nr:hypothetical protein [Halobacteria archaeon AArc-xg1-1]
MSSANKRWSAKAREGRNRRAYPLASKPDARTGRSRCGERPHARNGRSRVMRKAAAASGAGRRRKGTSARNGPPIAQQGWDRKGLTRSRNPDDVLANSVSEGPARRLRLAE